MDFRRSGQLDERRRRVLMDEIAAPAETDAPDAANEASGAAKGALRAYSPAVLSERQPRVTDLIPVRPFLVVFLILLGVTVVAAIETIHIHAAGLPRRQEAGQLAAFDVTQRGSLAAWYSSLLLALAAAGSLLVFGIRAHRVDDYRGRYRIWLWTAAACAWLSLDAATGIHDALGLAVSLLAGRQLLTGALAASCTITWMAVYSLVLGTLAVRLAIEVWPSLAGFAALLVAGLLYLLAGLMKLEMLTAGPLLIAEVLRSSVTLLAHVSLSSCVGLYLRHVYLDAQGRLKVQMDSEKKRSKTKRSAALKAVKQPGADASSHDAPAAGAARSSADAAKGAGESPRFGAAAARSGASLSKAALSSPDYDDEDDEEYDGGERLSKSERRRLKKLARQQQRRAA